MTLDLSLYKIEEDLVSLMQMREEATDPDEIRVLDEQLQAYVRSEVRKVDNIYRYYRMLDSLALGAKAEAEALQLRAARFRQRIDRLKSMVQFVMESMPWAEGKPRKLEGATASIYLKGNGGKRAVDVRNPELVPEEYCEYQGRLSGPQWKALEETALELGDRDLVTALRAMLRTPLYGRIGEALEARCQECDGSGIEGLSGPCPACAGSGKRSVAGCRLLPRSSHVEIR